MVMETVDSTGLVAVPPVKVQPVKEVENGEQQEGEEVIQPEIKDEQGSEVETPEGNDAEQGQEVEVKKEPETISKELAEARINRMYARLKAEQEKNRVYTPPPTTVVPNEDADERPIPAGLTQEQAEAIWDMKQKEQKFKENEMSVLMRHPEALDDDGNFNMKDPFVQAYIDIGKNNPSLAWMVDGPLLAEAMVEKHVLSKLPDPIKEKKHAIKAAQAHTAKSTVAKKAVDIIKLTDQERRIAKRMNLTEKQYYEAKARISKGDKRIV